MRIRSVDVFRGLTLLAMFYVNSIWGRGVPDWMKHASGDGLTFVDLVAPYFIFIVGVSVPFARRKWESLGASDREYWRAVVVRSAFLGLIGVLLVSHGKVAKDLRIPWLTEALVFFVLGVVVPGFQTRATPRWPRLRSYRWILAGVLAAALIAMAATERLRVDWGILQAIAVSYLLACLLSRASRRTQAVVLVIMAAAHTAYVWCWAPHEPGFQPLVGAGFVDLTTRHGGLPSGLSWSFCAIAGTWAGTHILDRRENPAELCARLAEMGAVLCVLGLMLYPVLAFNSGLATITYMVFATGLGCITLLLTYCLVDLRQRTRAFWFAETVGRSSILAFVLSIFVYRWLGQLPFFELREFKTTLYSAWGVWGVVTFGLGFSLLIWLLVAGLNRLDLRVAV